MKTIFKKLTVLFLVAIGVAACKKDTEYKDNGVAPVTAISLPAANAQVALFNSPQAKLLFQWTPSSTNSAPTYAIVFYKTQNGAEIYRIAADNAGQMALGQIKHRDLASVAAAAGIAPGATGDVYWTVYSSQGENSVKSTVTPRKLTLTRYAGIDDVPLNLYITGEASEAGTTIGDATKFRNLGSGRFELYTKLSSTGAFNFVNRNVAGDMRTFGFDTDKVLVEGTDPSSVATESVYRIIVDFAQASVVMDQITEVYYYYPSGVGATQKIDMTYNGNGVWKLPAHVISFTDDRYHFRATVNGATEWWGSNAKDGSGAPAELTGSAFDIYIRAPETDNWWYTFKYMPLLQGLTADYYVDMSPTVEHYNFRIDIGEVSANPVPDFTAPAVAAEILLSKVAGTTSTFSWSAAPTTGSLVPQYSLILYKDADGLVEVNRFSADVATTINVTHADLEIAANTAGIVAEATGDLYWSVETKVFDKIATATEAPRKLTVTRLQGIPANVYITGEATEFGTAIASAQKMKKTAEGQFEIYTKLSATKSYQFVTGTSGTYETFSVNAAKEVVAGGVTTAAASDQIYLIKLNFLTNKATMSVITLVQMKMIGGNVFQVLDYAGNGVWSKTNVTAKFDGSWQDDRFHYQVTVGGVVTKYGSNTSNFNNGASYNVKVAEGEEPYWVYPVTGNATNDDWGWKVWSGYRGTTTKTMDVKLNLSSTVPNYYTYINYLSL